MTDLLTRLEGATEGSFALDLEIAELLWTGVIERPPMDDEEPYSTRRFTTSIDAALALAERVLPEMEVVSGQHWACISHPTDVSFDDVRIGAHTRPLAICIAIIKAKEAQSHD